MMILAGRGQPDQLSLSLRHVTRGLHDVSEERFVALDKAEPGRTASHLTRLTQTLFTWHEIGSGARTVRNVPRVVARVMAEHKGAVGVCAASTQRALPPALAPFTLANRGEALGSAYTLCGAGLGLRAALRGADLAGPSEQRLAEGLAQAGSAMGRRWRAVRRAIDLWGLDNPGMEEDVLEGARKTFRVAITALDEMIEHGAAGARRDD